MANQIPSKLYKYQPYTVWSLDNLRNRQIRFSKPSEFNDPFDCAIAPMISEPSEDEWQQIYSQFREDSSDKNKCDLTYHSNNKLSNDFKERIRTASKRAFEERRDITLNERGVACFSETFDDLLMWSHYTNGHRGFCLEFNTACAPFQNAYQAFQINYSDVIPALNPTLFLREGPIHDLMDLLRTKSRHWCYEKEWRIFHKVGNQQYQLDDSAITAIYLGCAMPDTHKQIISVLLAHSSIRRYEMERVNGRFMISPKEVVNDLS